MDRIENDEVGGGFARRHRIKITMAALAIVGLIGFLASGKKHQTAKRPAAPQVVAITLPPPPPPPPPPPREPRPEPPPSEQMIAQETITEPEPAPAEAAAPADSALGTGLKGDGPPDGFGLGTSKGGGRIGGTGSGQRVPGSRFGWYAGPLKPKITDVLQKDPRTRVISYNGTLRVWLDPLTGRVIRTTLSGSGSAADKALIQEQLVQLQLDGPPPKDMPMPIVIRLTLQRPFSGT
jgi:hypothetical protein